MFSLMRMRICHSMINTDERRKELKAFRSVAYEIKVKQLVDVKDSDTRTKSVLIKF